MRNADLRFAAEAVSDSKMSDDGRAMCMRILRIYLPTQRITILHLITLAAGIMLAFVIGGATPGFLYFTLSDSDNDLPWLVAILCIIGAVATPIVWVWMYQRQRHHRLMRPTCWRTERLRAVFNQPQASARLPHRWIEHILRSPSGSWRRVRRAIATMKPGTMIAITERGYAGPARPLFSIPFEPANALLEDERAWWTAMRHWMRDEEFEQPEVEAAEVPPDPFWRRFLRHGRLVVYSLFLISLSCIVVLGSIIDRNYVWLIVLGLSLVGCYGWRLLIDEQWWVIPGGLVQRRDLIGMAGPRLRLATPDESPLLLDVRSLAAIVVFSGWAHGVQLNSNTLALLLGAWMSKARRPTTRELESLLNGRFDQTR